MVCYMWILFCIHESQGNILGFTDLCILYIAMYNRICVILLHIGQIHFLFVMILIGKDDFYF